MWTQLFARPFLKSELRRVWEPGVWEKVQLAVSQILQDLKVDGKPDLFKWWMFLATDVSGHLMFGESFDMLHFSKVSHVNARMMLRVRYQGVWDQGRASVARMASVAIYLFLPSRLCFMLTTISFNMDSGR